MNANDFELETGIGLTEGDLIEGYTGPLLLWAKGILDYVGDDFVALTGGHDVMIHNIRKVNGKEIDDA